MPVYPYVCEQHGDFEVFRNMTEVQAIEPCPQCGNASRRRWTPTVGSVNQGGYNESLDAYVGSKSQEREAIKKIEEKSNGDGVTSGEIAVQANCRKIRYKQ